MIYKKNNIKPIDIGLSILNNDNKRKSITLHR